MLRRDTFIFANATALLIGLLSFARAADLKVPHGFVVQAAAVEPETRFPMFATVDERGRLFVAESSGLDLYKEISAGTRKCQVRLLEDHDGDGKYEIAKLFADKLVFPMGLAWRAGKLYIADPPELITLEDTNGDDRADKRTVILSSFGAKDNGSLHGLVFGPDGLLYMTTGQPDGYRFELPGGKVLEGVSGALIRCRPDGSNPEVLARGFENLVEVIFMPGGEIIGTDNWYQHPQGGIRDALLHLVEGGLYPMKGDSGTPQPVTGDLLPPLALYPAVALSGLVRLEGVSFPREWHGLFSAQHNSRKIGRHVLSRHGSTFVSEDSDFLTTDDPDFHPSDVLEDKDGSLLVLDTGSWYTQHCPTGRIRQSPAKGGIYRIRYTGLSKGERVPPDPTAALWSMVSGAINNNSIRTSLQSTNIDIASVAARVAGLRQMREFAPELTELVGQNNSVLQLVAAEALARIGATSAAPALVEALCRPADRFVEHALIHALHRLAGESILRELLGHENPRVQKAALVLLSQSPRSPDALQPEMVMARVQHSDPGLRRAALELLKSRPKWSASALQIGKQWLAASELTEEHRTGLAALAGTFFDSSEFQAALRAAVREGSLDVRNFVLDLAGRQPPPRDTAAWSSMLRDALTNEPVRLAAVRVAVAWRLTALQDRLRQLAEDSAQPPALRKEALRGVIASYSPPPPAVFRFLLDELRGADALTSADLLRKARLTDEQLIEALGVTNTMVPPASLLGAFHTSTSTQRTRDLLDVVSKLPPAGWSADQYSEFLRRIPPDLRGRGEALRKRFEPDREAQQMRMANYEPLLKGGDSDRGHTVFKSARTACLTCHAVGNTGGRIGPDLTRLGAIRSGRDILESILFPSSTFAQHYEPFTIETNDGEEHTGTLVEQDERRLVLRNVSGNEITFPRSAVKQLRRTPVSVMPEGLEAALTDAEFRDLLAYLQNLK